MNKLNMHFFAAFLISVALVAVQSHSAWAQYDADAKKVLDAMTRNYKANPSFEAGFSYKLESEGEGINDSFEGKIMVKENKYFLDLGNQAVYNNERYVWTHLKDEQEVTWTVYEPDPDDLSPTEIYTMYQDGFKYRIVGTEQINGKAHDVVELNPQDRTLSYHKIVLSISKDDHTLSRWQIFEKNGRKYTYNIKNYMPRKNLKDKDFEFDVAKFPGVEIIDLR